jgi:hypothetical protein
VNFVVKPLAPPMKRPEHSGQRVGGWTCALLRPEEGLRDNSQHPMPNVWNGTGLTPERIAARERFWKRFWLIVAIAATGLLAATMLPIW